MRSKNKKNSFSLFGSRKNWRARTIGTVNFGKMEISFKIRVLGIFKEHCFIGVFLGDKYD